MWRVTPPGYVQEYGESSAIRTRTLYMARHPPRPCDRPRGERREARVCQGCGGCDNRLHGGVAALRQVHVPEARPGVEAAGARAARTAQARVHGRVRGLRRRPPAAVLLA